MALPTFDKKDEIPKGFESLYEEKDGKWHAKEKDDDASDLKDTLKKERDRADAAEKLTKKVTKELDALKNKQKANEAGLTDEELQKIRDDARKEIEAELAPKLTKAEELEKENRTLKLDNAVQKMAGEAGFLSGKLGDYWKLYGDEFDLTADGKPMVKGKPGVDPKKHIESHKALQPGWVQGTQAGGGGAAGIQQQPGKDGASALSPVERLAAAHAAGAKA
jgi:hypothetical protein